METDIEKISFCDQSFLKWLKSMEAEKSDVWDEKIESHQRTLWNARLFPTIKERSNFKDWIWMFDPSGAEGSKKRAWKKADRFSLAEMAILASQKEFHNRRIRIRSKIIGNSFHKIFSFGSHFSAKELSFILINLNPKERNNWISKFLNHLFVYSRSNLHKPGMEQLELSRLLHTFGTTLTHLSSQDKSLLQSLPSHLETNLDNKLLKWLRSLGLDSPQDKLEEWGIQTKKAAFSILQKTIISSAKKTGTSLKNALRNDEIVWSRAPVRFDLGGGWSDTPPYSLENGGCVINAAANLNGQAPIQVYARIIEEPEIRINSIDHSSRIVIRSFNELQESQQKIGQFSLAKAALVSSGFSSASNVWSDKRQTLSRLLWSFGGGIELTTLAAIPSGSGLGTSSIMGAVLLSAIYRLMGVKLERRELFHKVLKLEQTLTTGGGWQDQIGGVIDGVKIIQTTAGLIPDPQIQYIPPDVLDPKLNQGQTLLYYTGIRRLAKKILHDVVGNYLNRNRNSLNTLNRIHSLPPYIGEAMSRKDIASFGKYIDYARKLNEALDPESTTAPIQKIIDQISPYIHGVKLLGAGGGGFLFIVCKSPEDSSKVKTLLNNNPPNPLARFFDYDLQTEGLVVTVS